MTNLSETLSHSPLSLGETEILSLVLRGHSNKVIAQDLGVTEADAKAQLESVLRKINVENRTQAAIWALASSVALGVMSDAHMVCSPYGATRQIGQYHCR